MSFITQVVDSILGNSAEIASIRRIARRQEDEIAELKRSLAQNVLLPGAEEFRPTAFTREMVRVKLTEFEVFDRWSAVRISIEKDGFLYEDDTEDTEIYHVSPGLGYASFFVGCRGWAVFDRILLDGPDPIAIYEMISGEAGGFIGETTGPPVAGSGTELWYPWQETGVATGNHYTDETEIDPGVPLGKALMISSLANDPLITERNELPTFSALRIWYDTTFDRFVCESANEAMYDEECP